MSGLFGSGFASKEAARQAAMARREQQTSSEEEARARQHAERGAPGGGRGRNMLIGNLSSVLNDKLGG